MAIEVSWYSQIGTRTSDNRDCGGIGVRADEALCMVLDGSTTAPDSGVLARQIIRDMVDWYVASDEAITAESLTGRLRQVHGTLSRQYLRGSASYMIVHLRGDALLVLHAGDCLLGQRESNNEIAWLTQPHTLANATGHVPVAIMARLTTRHRLTRSFRMREFVPPDAAEFRIEKELVVATDGFWAELGKDNQALFLEGQSLPTPIDGDDRSVLRIRLLDVTQDIHVRCDERSTEGFYAKFHEQIAGSISSVIGDVTTKNPV
jgi:serine/threonine protein phosphatase PrpC